MLAYYNFAYNVECSSLPRNINEKSKMRLDQVLSQSHYAELSNYPNKKLQSYAQNLHSKFNERSYEL